MKTKPTVTFTVWFKSWRGQWVSDKSFRSAARAEARRVVVAKTVAANGRAAVFTTWKGDRS